MMNRILGVCALALALLAPAAHARGGVPIINHENVAVNDSKGQPAKPAQIKAAVMSAATARGWQISESGPNSAVATYHVRGKHTISTDVSWTPGTYTVKYRDSANMNYAGNEIHPNYNKWVQDFVNTIRIEVAGK